MLKFLFFLVVFALFAFSLLYFVFMKGDGNWSILPAPLRYVILPIYAFVAVFFGLLVFQLYLFIPNAIAFIINQILCIVMFFVNIDSLIFLWQLIGDLLVGPYLFLTVFVPVILIDFKHSAIYNFNYRRIVLIAITLLLLYEFTIDTLDGLAWYENALFCIFVIVAAVMTYFIMLDDLGNSSEEKEFWDKLKDAFKFIFSKKNPLVKIFRQSPKI